MKIKDITTIIENFAPLAYQESYDNSGLIVGALNDEVSGVLICLDCLEEILEEAISNNCNLVIAHHPIVFSGLKQINGKNYIERIVIKAIKNNIAIYAAHTNLDNVKNGVSFKIAEKIGVKNCRILQPKKSLLSKIVTFCPTNKVEAVRLAMFNSGAGSIGNYEACSFNLEGIGTFNAKENASPFVGEKGKLNKENETRIEIIVPSYKVNTVIENMIEAHPYEEVAYDVYELENKSQEVGSGVIGELNTAENELDFLSRIKKELKTGCIRHTELLGKKIKKVAICGGSGSFLLNDVKSVDADILITADFKYHQFFDADNKIIVADVGHYESEQYTSELIYEILNEKIPNFAIRLSKISTNPVNYL